MKTELSKLSVTPTQLLEWVQKQDATRIFSYVSDKFCGCIMTRHLRELTGNPDLHVCLGGEVEDWILNGPHRIRQRYLVYSFHDLFWEPFKRQMHNPVITRDQAIQRLKELGAMEKPKFTVGVSVLLTKNRQALMGKRKNTDCASGWLSTPGGHIELNEDIFGAAIREVKEETGLTIYRHTLQMLGAKEHFRFNRHYFQFYVWAPSFIGEVQNCEPDKCEGWEWFPVSDIMAVVFSTEPKDILETLKLRIAAL